MLWFSNPRKRNSATDASSMPAIETGGRDHLADAGPQNEREGRFSPTSPSEIEAIHSADLLAMMNSETSDVIDMEQSVPDEIGPGINGDTTDNVPPAPPNNTHPLHRPVGHRQQGGVAFALGGGVAKGWAHIGVLRAADEFGLPVSMIAGTSIGALVGGCYLSGNLDQLEEFARSVTRANMIRYLDFTLRGSGLIAGSRLAKRMEGHLGEIRIEEMSKPFVAVSTEINSGHEVWLSDGPIVPALRASYALPGVFTPVLHGGRHLVDGALVNPVPVSVCRAYEPDMVIAVNLNTETFGRATVIRHTHDDAIDDAITNDKNSQAASWFAFKSSREKASHRSNRLGVTSVMVEAFNIIQDRISRARLAGDPPDFTIRPKLASVGLIDFHKADEAIDLGYQEMMIRLTELKEQGVLEPFLATQGVEAQA